jgi:hypothetical protein
MGGTMTLKDTVQHQQLVEALAVLKDLNVPEHLQQTALSHLLSQPSASGQIATPSLSNPSASTATTKDLRAFIAELKPKGAVTEIPCLLYWAKMYEERESLDEKGVIEFYRRAGLRPPKNVAQSLRDLCSKRYGRLEVADSGQVRLSRVGEDFVLHDVIKGE